jgi:hypothetical protein
VLIAMLLLTPTVLTRMQDRTTDVATQAAADDTLYSSLSQYCYVLTGHGGEEPCMSWTEQVIAEHHEAAVACVTPTSANTPETLAQAHDCLAAGGVPEPL